MFNVIFSDEVPIGEIWFLNIKKLKEVTVRKRIRTQKQIHQFERYKAKGFLTATGTRLRNLIYDEDDDNFTDDERTNFRLILSLINKNLAEWKNVL